MEEFDRIDLQGKTHALPGRIESYWFENSHIGLKKTLFHRIYIPLSQFDSGLEYEEQPVNTEIVFEWYELKLSSPEDLDGLDLSHKKYPDAEASVYVGCAHNWCNVEALTLTRSGEHRYNVVGDLIVEFQREGVAKNERFTFSSTATYEGA